MAHSFNKLIIKEYRIHRKGTQPEVKYDFSEPEILRFFLKFSIYFELRNSIKDYAAPN